MNLATFRAAVLSEMDATDSGRWLPAEVDRKNGATFDALWRNILNANPYYLVGQRTPTSDSDGRYLIDDLSTETGDLSERFYRILGVQIDGYLYDGPVQLTDWASRALSGNTADQRVWYQEGRKIVAMPIQASKLADAFWVNYIPQRPDLLEGDDSEINFPDGHEEVLITLSAARLLSKGAAETQAAAELRAMIRPDYDELMADVARTSIRPTMIQYGDTSFDWGQ